MQLPIQAGQICRLTNPVGDENPEDVYIVAEDPAPFNHEDEIYIVSLRDLQRNISNPSAVTRIQVVKSDLDVVSENLEEYVKSWNQPA